VRLGRGDGSPSLTFHKRAILPISVDFDYQLAYCQLAVNGIAEGLLEVLMRKQLAEIVADLSGTPVTTVENNLIPRLQSAGLLPSLRRGDGEVDATYRVTVLMGAALDREHGVSVGENVRHWRSLPFASTPLGRSMQEQFGIRVDNVGTALDDVLEKLFRKRVKNPIRQAKGPLLVTAEFLGTDQFKLIFGQSRRSVLDFGRPDSEGSISRIERIVRIPHAAFERLATE
jgi:hypothetical protein